MTYVSRAYTYVSDDVPGSATRFYSENILKNIDTHTDTHTRAV